MATKSLKIPLLLKKIPTKLPKIHPLKFVRSHKRSIAFFILVPILVLFISIFLLFKDVPNPGSLTRTPAPVSTQILDRNGKLLYEIYLDKNRTPIKINDLPSYVKESTLAIEDKNFYHHLGIDFVGVLRAAFKTLSGQRLEGGSTITQQLVKIALLDDSSRTLTRKFKEAVLALLTEATYSKDQILELYLNYIPYGGTAYGIQTASRQFFDKDAKDLTLAEASLLVGLPQSPTRYSPFGAHPELAKQRQQQVLNRMVEDHYITQAQADEAYKAPLNYAQKQSTIKAPHFVLWIKDLLVAKYGEDAVNLGGLKVTTSLDLDIQQTAQASVSAEVKKLARLKVGNGAALVTRPKTGEVLAMVGSRDYFDTEHDGQVNVTTSLRQPGSSIKPINYATGILGGWTASTMFLDIPTCFQSSGQKDYCPKNYDNSFHGPVQLRFALGNSLNIPAVKMLALNGIDGMIATASAMGITGWNDPSKYGLSLTLGGGEVRMVDLAVAFGVFANAGVKVPLHPILKVETYQGKVLEQLNLEEINTLTETTPKNYQDFQDYLRSAPPPESTVTPTSAPATFTLTSPYKTFIDKLLKRPTPTPTPAPSLSSTQIADIPLEDQIKPALPEEVAFIISHILLDNNARSGAFGTSSELVIPNRTVSVKTGTTNDLRDNWTIGYTPDYLTAVWVGNNDNTPMSYVASGVTGASPIWHDIMAYILKPQKDHFPTQPSGVITALVCTTTGLIPTAEAPCDTRTEYFIKDQLPINNYPARKQIWLRRDTHLPVLPGEQVVDLDLEEHAVLSDPFIHDFCIDCAYPQITTPDPADPSKNVIKGISYPTFNVNYDIFHAKPPTPTDWLTSNTPTTLAPPQP